MKVKGFSHHPESTSVAATPDFLYTSLPPKSFLLISLPMYASFFHVPPLTVKLATSSSLSSLAECGAEC